MRILVLGGTQFVGRAIVDRLLAGHEVTVLNRGTHPLWDSRISQVVADRTQPQSVAAALTERYDAVVDVSATEPAHVSNVLPAVGDVRYVFISSAAVYDRSRAAPPFREEDPAGGDAIWGSYGVDKAACETVLRDALPDRLTILRPPYVYGPHNIEQREQFLWARMLSGQPIFVPGDGSTRIQFCLARALADVVAIACADGISAGAYNVGEARSYSFNEYLDVLSEICGAAPRLVHVTDNSVPAREYFPFRRADLVLDVGKLGGLAEVPLRSGLATTLDWFQRAGEIVDEPTEREKAWRSGMDSQ
jgi:nucleoside-diphosphate-sugar epimerase